MSIQDRCRAGKTAIAVPLVMLLGACGLDFGGQERPPSSFEGFQLPRDSTVIVKTGARPDGRLWTLATAYSDEPRDELRRLVEDELRRGNANWQLCSAAAPDTSTWSLRALDGPRSLTVEVDSSPAPARNKSYVTYVVEQIETQGAGCD